MPKQSRGKVIVELGFISISDQRGEIVYWDESEWREDPSLVPRIVLAVTIFYKEGPSAVRKLLRD